MRAVVYNGPRQVSVAEVAEPRIEQPTDAIVRITTSNICGSDLHMYEGRTDFEPGRTFGHRAWGEFLDHNGEPHAVQSDGWQHRLASRSDLMSSRPHGPDDPDQQDRANEAGIR